MEISPQRSFDRRNELRIDIQMGNSAGIFPLDDRRLLAASMDSVGSKLMLARRAGRLRWAGMDLAAHCINDVLCTGAEPLFLLDYVAANRIDAEQVDLGGDHERRHPGQRRRGFAQRLLVRPVRLLGGRQRTPCVQAQVVHCGHAPRLGGPAKRATERGCPPGRDCDPAYPKKTSASP